MKSWSTRLQERFLPAMTKGLMCGPGGTNLMADSLSGLHMTLWLIWELLSKMSIGSWFGSGNE
ncbi:hypothetical protein LINPERHAP1_LOCUS14054 [Linum perenne]